MFNNVLIIGGCGFVGSNLCKKLLPVSNNITIVDNLISSEVENIPVHHKIKLIVGSIIDDNILLNLPKTYDYIFHLATYHGNQSSICNPIEDNLNNLLPTLKLCEYFKDSTVLKKFVYSSAGCVVCNKTYKKPNATSEDANISLYLDSPYQISKIVGELYGNYYFKHYNFPFVKARFQNVYGPGEILGAGIWRGTINTVWRNVIPTFIWKALNNIPITLDNNGESTRDFIFIDDVINGLILCSINGKNGEVYNIASGKEITIKYVADIIINILNSKSNIQYLPRREWDNSGRRFATIDKSKNDLKFICENTFESGILKTIEWTIENKLLIEKNINKHNNYIKLL